ncbi:type I phosphomannose isomerase catalytic subunit [Ichthyobacterium seriolicida]|uniref:Phosphohexomutase n=1 Tax=Ichthyobacterium seriolicida TaxID=242600 RepID=A0A1J1DXY6_9FLAO|nr:type I phosphomannose isomerase catalytic subunit [Ichthyobacterium seriolicida]BAV94746.1 mannose-6-phosphate isomerase [Ichthyobacterium seriolicida]
MELYPLKFKPILKHRIWGGNKLKTLFGKETFRNHNIGESWELSGLEDSPSEVINGPLKGNTITQITTKYKDKLLGKRVYEKIGNKFPLLVKLIDAEKDLSIQVHPDNALAQELHNSFGKNEMWYVMQADDDSEIVVGFNKSYSKKEYVNHLKENTLLQMLNRQKIEEGEVYFIPPGTVHAIGKGILIAEIQQSSDITYRIFDFDRLDENGHTRELHTQLALRAIDFNSQDTYKRLYNRDTENALVCCDYFTSRLLIIKGSLKRDYTDLDSFVIFLCVRGSVTISTYNSVNKISMGETILIPSSLKKVELNAQYAELLEIFV